MLPSLPSSQLFSSHIFRRRRLRWLYLVLLCATIATFSGAWPTRAAGPAALVKDINTASTRTNPPSIPSPAFITSAGPRVYFLGYDLNNGYELWSSDGTPTGTRIVRDIAPGNQDTLSIEMADVAGILYFSADTAGLWKSDGTATGTVRMKLDGRPGALTNVNGTLFFVADNQNGQHSLWKSDGTAAGTVMVKDIDPTYLASVGGKLFFIASDGVNGRELWTSDGTSAGTVMVKDINPAGDSFNQNASPDLTDVGGKLFFITTGLYAQLWQSDGTADGTTRVTTSDSALQFGVGELANVNGELFFSADSNDGPTGGYLRGLWKSDGTPAGTTRVKDFGSVLSGSLSVLSGIGNQLFFAGPNHKLWTSDGSDLGTTQVGDVTLSSHFTNVGGTAFFVGQDGDGDLELWKSDGTGNGTLRVQDINLTGSSAPSYLAALGNTVLFAANSGAGSALWKSDGTAAGTALVKDTAISARGIDDPSFYSPPLSSGFVGLGGNLFFVPDGESYAHDLWISDGTANGTKMVKPIDPVSVNPYSLVACNGTLFFIGGKTASVGLWKSDGTEAGTTAVKLFAANTLTSSPRALTDVNGTLFFFTGTSSGYPLWKSDGTEAGTTLVATLPAQPSDLTNVNGRLFFVGSDSAHGAEPWISDGTAAGTHLLKEIRPTSDSSDPFALTDVNGTLYFMVRLGNSSDYELWKSDGTATGTVRVKDFGYGIASPYGPAPDYLTTIGSRLFFTAYDSVGGMELWVSDGTESGTQRVKDINTIVNFSQPYSDNKGSNPFSLTNLDGTLIFSADDGVHGRELWRSDGTESGTVLVKDINPGDLGSGFGAIRSVGYGLALLAASDGFGGIELWKTDGTPENTQLLQDIAPGASSSNPTGFAVSGARVFFVADDNTTGSELWSLDTGIFGDQLTFKQHLPLLER